MIDDVIECLTGACAVLFSPDQLIQKLLYNLTAQEAESVLKHSRNDASGRKRGNNVRVKK